MIRLAAVWASMKDPFYERFFGNPELVTFSRCTN